MPDTEVKTTLTLETAGDPTALRQAADDVTALGEAADNVATSLQSITTALEALGAAGAGALQPLLAQLDQVLAKAQETAAALQQITGGGAAGASQ